MPPLRTFVIGLGQMGMAHAMAYHTNPGFQIVGLCNRSEPAMPEALCGYPRAKNFAAGLALQPDVVSINTYTDSHADDAVAAMATVSKSFAEGAQ